MKSPMPEQLAPCPGCDDHDWQPLFAEPSRPEDILSYMSQGHADFRQCARCGALGLVAGGPSHGPHLLSESFAVSKRREAVAWNESQHR